MTLYEARIVIDDVEEVYVSGQDKDFVAMEIKRYLGQYSLNQIKKAKVYYNKKQSEVENGN